MFSFTPSQAKVIDEAVKWYRNSSDPIFEISGNPGTGKSVVLAEVVRRLGLNMGQVAPMAYTGAAAVVMRMKGFPNAKTIHSWIYEPIEVPVLDATGAPVFDNYLNRPKMRLSFIPRNDLKKTTKLIVIDEAGSVPISMKQDILNVGAKIIVAGDLDQLPPIEGNSAFLCDVGRVHRLTDIMRQAAGSAIIYLSQRAKANLPINVGYYGNVLVITEDEVTDDMLSASSVILCGKNRTRDRLTNYYRNNILRINSPVPRYGEKLLCRKNNWGLEMDGINLTNGLSGILINDPSVEGYDGKSFVIDFVPDVIPHGCFRGLRVNAKYFLAPSDQKKFIKDDKYTRGELFEFGYCETVHLAQGSQWTHGIYFEEYLNPQINAKLNYTAISRFSHSCIYVIPKRKYF